MSTLVCPNAGGLGRADWHVGSAPKNLRLHASARPCAGTRWRARALILSHRLKKVAVEKRSTSALLEV